MLFYSNKAPQGVALFVDDTFYTYDDLCQNVTKFKDMACFFKIDAADTTSLDVHLNFTHNSADLGGAALFESRS